MRIEGIGEVHAFEHGVAAAQAELLARRCLHQDTLCVDGHDPRLVGVEQPALVVVVGPTDFVTFNDGQRFALEERQPAIVCARPQARGIELAKPSFPVLKHELLPRMVNGLDGVVIRENGKPDYLRKHLDRVEILRGNIDAVARFTKVADLTDVESHLVFADPVPLEFALAQMSEQVRISHFDRLGTALVWEAP